MDRLIAILTDIHADVDFTSHERLIDDGVLDSFDIITIAAEISEEFGVDIPADKILPENFNCASSLYNLIQELEE